MFVLQDMQGWGVPANSLGVRRCEPTNVRWDHLGLGLCSRRLRFLGVPLAQKAKHSAH